MCKLKGMGFSTSGIEGRRLFSKTFAGISLIEILLGITLFVLMFSHVMTAFAPTATDYNRLVRGYTLSITIANWYINHLEGLIFFQGELPATELGLQMDKTSLILDNFRHAAKELPKLKVLVNQSLVGNKLYQIDLTVNWETGAKPHQYAISRLKAAPRY